MDDDLNRMGVHEWRKIDQDREKWERYLYGGENYLRVFKARGRRKILNIVCGSTMSLCRRHSSWCPFSFLTRHTLMYNFRVFWYWYCWYHYLYYQYNIIYTSDSLSPVFFGKTYHQIGNYITLPCVMY